MKPLLYLTLPFYLLDQITKWLVLRNVSQEEIIPVIPGFFNIVQVHNTGAAFGMLSNQNLFFIFISAITAIVLGFLWWRNSFTDLFSRLGVALLFAGIFGNLTDRLLHGHVVDFLDFILPWYGRWPAFNVADSCIFVAVGLFLYSSFRDGLRAKNQQSSDS